MRRALFILYLLIHMVTRAQTHTCDANTFARKAAGNYNIKVAGCENYIDIYIYDKKNKPLVDAVIMGHAGFYYPDESYLSEDLTQSSSTNALRVKVPYPGFSTFKISLIINGQNVSAYFENDNSLRATLQQ